MMTRLRYCVITTRDREQDFADCLAAIRPQVDAVVVVAHMEPPYVDDCRDWPDGGVLDYSEDPPNISRMWNWGIAAATEEATFYSAPCDIAVLNDDFVAPPNWFQTITEAMRATGAVAGSGEAYGPTVPHGKPWLLNVTPRPDDLMRRMAGFGFIIDGTEGLSIDEQFQWWYGDRSLEMEARCRGGVVLVPGVGGEHRWPNSTTVGVLAEIADGDRQRFLEKWGWVG